MSTLGLKLLSGVVASNSVADFQQVNTEYLRPTEIEVFDYMQEHILKFGDVPKEVTILDKTGVSLPKAQEPVEFYVEELERRYLTGEINTTMMQVQESVTNKDPYLALDKMADTVATMLQKRAGNSLVDFRDAKEIMRKWNKTKLLKGYFGVQSGWPYLDTRMGGLEPGDVMSIVGRPAQGKTFLLLYMALHGWRESEQLPLFVTPEMKPMKIMERLTAMYTKHALTPIAKPDYTPDVLDKFVLSKMEKLASQPHPFWVVDGVDCQTIEDLFVLCRQLKPSAVYYDGAYLMKHKNPRMNNKWEKIAATASGLKDLASSLDLPVIASYQLGKEVTKKKKKDPTSTPGLEDIYGSDEIGQLSSVVLGLMDEGSVDKANKKTCTLLKGRGGEKGQWNINWNFHTMDFREIEKQESGEISEKKLTSI